MKRMKKQIAAVMVLATVFLIFACTQMSAGAASTAAYSNLSTSTYAKTYTLSSSGNTIPYTSKDLSTRGSVTYGKSSTAYIDNASDELYVFSVGKNSSGKYYAYVSYPISSSKRANAYIALSAITSNNGSHKATKSTGKFYCSTRSNNSTSSSYYVDKGDTVYLIATNGSKYQIMYPISNGKYRIAWCSSSNYNKYCGSGSTGTTTTTVTTSQYQVPMKNYKMTNGFGNYCSYMSDRIYNGKTRAYHLGIDYCAVSGGDRNIYAFASGKVVKCGYNDANGYYVIIQHTISGKTVYSFYAHLSSYCVSANSSISVGKKVGVVGHTGSGGNGVDHLHFAVADQLWSGSYWGYGTYFTGNKTNFAGVNYYNPEYIIKYGKLPA